MPGLPVLEWILERVADAQVAFYGDGQSGPASCSLGGHEDMEAGQEASSDIGVGAGASVGDEGEGSPGDQVQHVQDSQEAEEAVEAAFGHKATKDVDVDDAAHNTNYTDTGNEHAGKVFHTPAGGVVVGKVSTGLGRQK